MAGVNGLYEHPVYADRRIALTTASGVHAATVAEYAMTVLLALAHRLPRMVEWREKGGWPPDRAAVAAVRAERGAGRDPRRDRLRQHRARARPDRQDRVRDARAGVQARSQRGAPTRATARGARAIPRASCRTRGFRRRG